MKVIIDADASPVVGESVALCKKFNASCVIVCDTSHEIEYDGVDTIVVDKGADSADFRIANIAGKGDIVITQDYALAAMVLARRARALNQNGMEYTEYNIDSLLTQRYVSKKVRDGGGRVKGPSKRTKKQTEEFVKALTKILEESL